MAFFPFITLRDVHPNLQCHNSLFHCLATSVIVTVNRHKFMLYHSAWCLFPTIFIIISSCYCHSLWSLFHRYHNGKKWMFDIFCKFEIFLVKYFWWQINTVSEICLQLVFMKYLQQEYPMKLNFKHYAEIVLCSLYSSNRFWHTLSFCML